MGSPIIRRDELEAILDAQADRILSEVAGMFVAFAEVAAVGDVEPDGLEDPDADPEGEDAPAAEIVEPAPEAEPAKPRKGRKAEPAPGETPDILSGLDEAE